MSDYEIIVPIAGKVIMPKVQTMRVPCLSSRRSRRGMVHSLLVSAIVPTRGRVRILTVGYCVASLINLVKELTIGIEY